MEYQEFQLMSNNRSNRSQLVLLFIVVVMVSALGAIYFWEPGDGISIIPTQKGTIGIIEVYGVLDDSYYAYLLSESIQEAINDDDIKAVVLEIDSPGGSAYLTEQVYLDLLELKATKPIVASCSMALSGGYFIAVSADHIFALPSGLVGNVGVIGTGPGWVVPSEVTLETGPHKITGFSPELYPFNFTEVLSNFAGAVELGRGTKLSIPMSDVRKGSVWLGNEALRNGIIDELGSTQSAIKYAASLASLTDWDTESLLFRVANETATIGVTYPTLQELNEKNPPPALFYLYMPGEIYMESEMPETANITVSGGHVGDVVVDMSHENAISPWHLDGLAEALVHEGIYMGYSSDWDQIEESLNETKALIISTPRVFYSYEEYTAINDWVNEGGTLIFLGDASSSFMDTSVLQGPLNSLSDHWNLHYSNGYLYNLEENYGIYRNLILTDMRESFLTEGVEELVFYTSGAIESRGSGVIKTSSDTYNSVSERDGLYSVAAVYDLNNSTVIAFGDLTWLVKPYLNAADNMVLLENLVEAIASVD
jgi:ClpP class serine protease